MAAVCPVQSKSNERKYQTAVTCPGVLKESTCNSKNEHSGYEPRAVVVDDGDRAGVTRNR